MSDSFNIRKRVDEKIVGLESGVQVFGTRENGALSVNGKRGKSFGEKPHQRTTIEEDEKAARDGKERRPIVLFLLQLVASIKVFFYYLITLDTIVSCALTATFTTLLYNEFKDSSTWNGGGMNWIILTFAVVTPITTTLSMAFTRRERALFEIARIRSFSFQIYEAHALWDWVDAKGGRAGADIDWLKHCDKVLAQLVGIGDELSRFLSLPTSSRTRHRMTRPGRREAAKTVRASYRLFDSLYTQRMARLSVLDERIRQAGLGSSEVSRIRQFERFIGEAMENLRMIKMYRTPQALRSFGRIFTLILVPFYSPYFAQLAIDLHSLAFGLAFGLLIAICLTALFESVQVLEDPFVGYLTLDGINVREEFEVLHWQQLVNTRDILFPDAPPFPEETRTAIFGPRVPELERFKVEQEKEDQEAEGMGKPKPKHRKVVSWDQDTLAATDFGSYVGDLMPPEQMENARERLPSQGSIRNSDFSTFLQMQEEDEMVKGSDGGWGSMRRRRRLRPSDHSVPSIEEEPEEKEDV